MESALEPSIVERREEEVVDRPVPETNEDEEVKDEGEMSEGEQELDIAEYEVNVLKESKLLVIPMMIKGQDISALLDSGAAMCFMPEEIAHDLRLDLDTKDQVEVNGYGNRLMKTLGSVMETVVIDNFTVNWKFHVLPSLCNQRNIIIGLDFLKRFSAEIDFGRRMVQLEYDKGHIIIELERNSNLIARTEYVNLPAYSTEEVVLSSGEVRSLKVSSGDLKMGENDYLFEGIGDTVEFMCGIVTKDKSTL